MNKLTTQEFINKSNGIHNNNYDYSLVEYVNSHVKVKIICLEHGVFEQEPNNHISGQGCPKCKNNSKKLNSEIFITKAKKVHGDKYDYSLVEYVNSVLKIKIICPDHGIFEQRASSHLSGKCCSKCVTAQKTSTKIKFIKKAKLVHGNKYNYSLVNYINDNSKINIVCPTHGDFKQKPSNHLQGQGCPICKESKGEREIRLYLNNLGIDFFTQHKFLKCKHKLQLPFDFYLPDYNICIEYQGEQHYKPVKRFGGENRFFKQQITDKIKSDYCSVNRINLIVIKYDQNIDDVLNLLISSISLIS